MRDSSEFFWLTLKASVIVEEPVSVEDAPLHYASLRFGGEGIHLQMLLILGWWSLVLFEVSIYKLRIHCHRALFLFTLLHSSVFLHGSSERYYLIYSYPKYMYFNKLLKTVWDVLWPTAHKKMPSNPRVSKMMEHFFYQNTFAFVHAKKIPLNLWTS